MFGRDGLLAHSYMLGPNGQSSCGAPEKSRGKCALRGCTVARAPDEAVVADAPRTDAPTLANWRRVNFATMSSSAIEPPKALGPECLIGGDVLNIAQTT